MSLDARRRLDARKFNEHVKLVVTTFNALAIFLIIAGYLQPLIREEPTAAGAAGWVWIITGVVLHIGAQALIRLLREET
jgi:hypothetical protein